VRTPLQTNNAGHATAFGEFTVPETGRSAVYQAASWMLLAKSRDFSTDRVGLHRASVELGSASMSGTGVDYPRVPDPETVP
jgi:hypothetical protein